MAAASTDPELLPSESGIHGRPPLPVVPAVLTLLKVPALLGLTGLSDGRLDEARIEVATGLGPAPSIGEVADSGELSFE